MRQIDRLFFLLLIVATAISCTGKSKQLQKTSPIESTIVEVTIQDAQLFNTKDIASSVGYIPLETKGECLVGDIKKIIQTQEGSFIILDSRQNKIFLFDSNGKFVTQIGVQGRGPNEYLYLNDIDYDPQTETIYAFERMKNTMLLFNLKGEIVETIPSEFSFNSFTYSKDGFWIYSCFPKNNPDCENLMLVDHKLQKKVEGYFPQKSFIGTTMKPLFKEDAQGTHYFITPFGNTIYTLNKAATPFMIINFKDQTFPFDQITESTSQEEYENLLNTNHYIGNISNIIFTKKYCFFNCSETQLNEPVKYFTVRVDRDNNKSQVYNAYMNGFGDLGVSLSKIYGVTANDELIYLITPNNIDMYALEKVQNTISKNISEESNPIITLFKLK